MGRGMCATQGHTGLASSPATTLPAAGPHHGAAVLAQRRYHSIQACSEASTASCGHEFSNRARARGRQLSHMLQEPGLDSIAGHAHNCSQGGSAMARQRPPPSPCSAWAHPAAHRALRDKCVAGPNFRLLRAGAAIAGQPGARLGVDFSSAVFPGRRSPALRHISGSYSKHDSKTDKYQPVSGVKHSSPHTRLDCKPWRCCAAVCAYLRVVV
ncbi:hypothetical protein V8C86DRAFT_2546278 [Haematococcus lacustris]